MGEYLWVTCCGSVSAVRLHNSRCSGGHGIFITIHYMEQTGIYILTWCGVSYGCCKIFGCFFSAYLTPLCSEMHSFSITSKHNTKPLSLFTWGEYGQNNSVLPHRTWHANALWPELNHTAHLKHITGWANISSYWCSESHGHSHYIGLKSQLVRTNPQGFLFSPSWLPGSPTPFIQFLYVPSSRVTTGFKGELIKNRSY